MLTLLQIRVQVHGISPGIYPPNHLLLSNHISWLDIFVLNAVTVSQFVAKSEIRNWPLIGRLCCGARTLFIERERRRDTARVNGAILHSLQQGECVAIFPEGTTSDGASILPFRSSLLQAAIDADATIQPVYLRYTNSKGQRCCAAAYVDEISFGESLWRILGHRGLTVELSFLAPFSAGENDRRALTQFVQSRIQAAHQAFETGHCVQ
ncbi:lysophospholipid acyltransferase family protein [Jeongeupia naejangsanensis]|uniref:1-acyl-sn-glycerol-3-phosphate acyltransferase n=1 Tax=Jeongeupia naejangsanensis TaxID=613195 RepID=A0ABS2BRV0_9NEIS|nr:lysophospholipid acyltransferase family protein [Jeongeupia naejangsanensis]MBM3117711.1 1-acyl-sn-glycerol-3-phosphate acyltransferase [Jeongeupia naejangsanensis]